MAEKQYADDEFDSRIKDAQDFLRYANDADSNNRSEALDDLRFSAGDQWPVEVQNSRTLEARPCLTINRVDAYCRQIVNQIRQQRPRIKVNGMNNESDSKVAQTLTGICRHIETQSDADFAYDNAVEFAVRMGWGYWRVNTRYVAPDSFDQEIYIDAVQNPFTVYFDPNSQAPDGSDAEKCLITTILSKSEFRKLYPDADDGSGFTLRGTGDTDSEWVMKEDIRIAEWFYKKYEATHLMLLSDGTHVYEDEMPKQEVLDSAGIYVVSKRKTIKNKVKWCKLTAMQILEEGDWAGKYIPVVPTYGQQMIVENKKKKFGLVRQAKDPQRMYNYWTTSITESVAMAPKAKWVMAEGQDEGHENEWAMANIKSFPVLRYKQRDAEGNVAPPPARMQPEPPPTGILAAAQSINSDLMAVVGIYDPSQLPTGMISGKALQGQQQQQDMTNFHFYDNLTRSIAHTGRIILDLVPKIYDKERVLRIIGEDGKAEMVTVNEPVVDNNGVEKILNDVTVGQYDVVMDTGPGYNTKRQESVDSMIQMMGIDPNLMTQAGDLVFRNMDFPGADIIADRLAAANPLAQIDENSEIPPQAQMQLAQAQKQIQDMQQVIQALQLMMKSRQDVEMVRQQGEDNRAMLNAEVKVHDQNTRAITSQNKTEIDALVQLILKNIDTNQLNREIAMRNLEQMGMTGTAVDAIQTMGPDQREQLIQLAKNQAMQRAMAESQQAQQMPQGNPQLAQGGQPMQ